MRLMTNGVFIVALILALASFAWVLADGRAISYAALGQGRFRAACTNVLVSLAGIVWFLSVLLGIREATLYLLGVTESVVDEALLRLMFLLFVIGVPGILSLGALVSGKLSSRR